MTAALDHEIEACVALLGAGGYAEALTRLAACRAAQPDNPHLPRLMGEAMIHLGRHAEAAPLLVDSLRLQPGLAALRALAYVVREAGNPADIDQLCRRFEALVQQDFDLLGLWGYTLNRLGRPTEAEPVLRRSLALKPDFAMAHHNLACCLTQQGRMEEAVAAYASFLRPWNGGEAVPHGVEALDAVARGYDGNTLHQSFSERLVRLHQETFPGRRLRRVLELGTGTGLLASRLPASATQVDGIELSPAMLAQARARGVYQTLIQGALPGVLETVEGPYDSILSSCVLYHFADLEPFFRQAARLLAGDGVFAFSVDPTTDDHDIAMTHAGEFAHSRTYLRRLAAAHGLREVVIEVDLHRGPPGFWCAFRKG